MKSVRLVAPYLAAGAAASVLDPRALLGVLPDGSECPAARADTLIVAPAFYSEFFPYNTVIDPFRQMSLFTVSHAPTTVVLTGEVPIETILGGSVTVIPTTGASTTTSASSSTITASAGPLSIGAGLPNGRFTDADDFIVLAYTSAFNQPAKREVKQQAKRQADSVPIRVVDLVESDAPNAYAQGPPFCDQATPLLLSAGQLVSGSNAVGKASGATQAVMGFLLNPGETAVNATMILDGGFITWEASDNTGRAVFYSCPDGLWAAFPTLDPTRLAQCTQVRAGAIAGAACSAYVQSLGRTVNPAFQRPANNVNPRPSNTSTSTTMMSMSAGTNSTTATMSMGTDSVSSETTTSFTGFANITTSASSMTATTSLSLPTIGLPSGSSSSEASASASSVSESSASASSESASSVAASSESASSESSSSASITASASSESSSSAAAGASSSSQA